MMLMESVAWAQGTGGSGSGSLPGRSCRWCPLSLIFVIFYFMLILPQQKKQKQQKAMMESLKKGDKVITASGIWGTVTNLGKGHCDAADLRQHENQNATGNFDCAGTRGRRRQRCVAEGRRGIGLDMKKVRARLLLLLLVLVISVVCFLAVLSPSLSGVADWWMKSIVPNKGIALGLDLQGGIHMVLEVDEDRAVEIAVDRSVVAIQDLLVEKKNPGRICETDVADENRHPIPECGLEGADPKAAR